MPGQTTDACGFAIVSLQFSPMETVGLKIASAVMTLHGARNVKAADMGGTSDPYVVVKLGGVVVYRSPVIYKTLNPNWEVSFTVDRIVANIPLVFEVWDEDRLSSDDFLGQTVLKLPLLYNLTKESFALVGRNEKDLGIRGELCLSLNFTPFVQLTASSSSASSASSPSFTGSTDSQSLAEEK